jgi:hypothetical protein
VRRELEALGIAFSRRLQDGPDLVRRVIEEQAAHLGHYVRIALILQFTKVVRN